MSLHALMFQKALFLIIKLFTNHSELQMTPRAQPFLPPMEREISVRHEQYLICLKGLTSVTPHFSREINKTKGNNFKMKF